MPHYHLNLFNDVDSWDDEGTDYEDLAAAKAAAIRAGRAMIADHINEGQAIHLSHRIEIADDAEKVLAVIPFREMVTILD